MAETSGELFPQYGQLKKWHALSNELISGRNEVSRPFEQLVVAVLSDIFSENRHADGFLDKIAPASLIKKIASDSGHQLSENIYKLRAFSNYAFSEAVFWHECESVEEFKKNRSSKPEELGILASSNEAGKAIQQDISNAVNYRRKAEELHKKGYVKDALKNLAIAEELFSDDFTALFFTALLLFFETGELDSALEYFKKAARASQSRSKRAFGECMAYIAFINIIKSRYVSGPLTEEALKAVAIAEACDGDSLFIKYAVAQCFAADGENAASSSRAIEIIENLISADPFYSIQIASDPVFDKISRAVELMLDNKIAALFPECQKLMAGAELLASVLPKKAEGTPEASKMFAVIKEYKSLKTNFAGARSFLELVTSSWRVKKNLLDLQRVTIDSDRHKLYEKLRTFAEECVKQYQNELGESLKPFSALNNEKEKLRCELQKLNLKYPSVTKKHEMEPSEDWKKTNVFYDARSYGGNVTMAVILAVIAAVYFLPVHPPVIYLILAAVINLVLTGVYGYIYGEFYYNYIQNMKKTLETDITRIDLKLDLNKKVPAEEEIKARDRFSKSIAENFNIDLVDAKNIFLAVLEGDPERIRQHIKR